MNITVYPNSYDWLFSRPLGSYERAWSLGRFAKPVEPDDWLHFRWNKVIVGRARCARVTKPGECDCEMHDGSRVLRGHKVHWLTSTFEDLREKPAVVATIEAEQRDKRRARARELKGIANDIERERS